MTIYKAAPSNGKTWLLITALSMVVLSVPAFLSGSIPAMVITLVCMGPLIVAAVLMAWWINSMRYELGASELVLRFGPFRYPIALADIQSVSKRNLAFSPWSSVRFPGFAMWNVYYADVKTVFMCATRSLTDILCIETRTRKYGITPADEAAFLADLQQRLKG